MKNKSKLQSSRERRYARLCDQLKDLNRKIKRKLSQIEELEKVMNVKPEDSVN